MDVPYQQGLCSIVIPIWNKAEETREFCEKAVASIVEHVKYPYELILVDNASPFPLAELWILENLSSVGVNYLIVQNQTNRGFGPAVNQGAAVAGGEFLCQMNSDCELVEDSVSILIGEMEKHQIDLGTTEHYENCLRYGLGKSDVTMGEDWFFGAFWICRRSVWDELGGFDEEYVLGYWEDSDLVKRARAKGYRVAGTRNTWVSHKGGASSHPDRDKYFELNRQRYEAKWRKK